MKNLSLGVLYKHQERLGKDEHQQHQRYVAGDPDHHRIQNHVGR